MARSFDHSEETMKPCLERLKRWSFPFAMTLAAARLVGEKEDETVVEAVEGSGGYGPQVF